MLFVQYYADLKFRLYKQVYMLCVIGVMFITGFKYFSVESYRYRTSFTAAADYKDYDDELEKRKLEEYLDAVKRNKDVKKEKNDQLKDFDRIRAEQGIEKVKDQKLHRQKTNKFDAKKYKGQYDETDEESEFDGDFDSQESELRKRQFDKDDDDEKNDELIEESDEEGEETINKDNRRSTKYKKSYYSGHKQKRR
jgi:hypothetical protein